MYTALLKHPSNGEWNAPASPRTHGGRLKTCSSAAGRPAAAAARARILVVDDHAGIRDPLAAYLKRQGLDAETASDAAGMHARLAAEPFDLVVLDIMLPDHNGLGLCVELTQTRGTPVILLTAKAAPRDRVAGLESGADDYVVKPFDPAELVARIRTVLRRQVRRQAGTAAGSRFAFEGWVLDTGRRELTDPSGQPVALSEAEFQVLGVLVANPGVVLTRDRLLDLIPGDDPQVFDRSIDSRVSRLRRKMEADPRRPALLKTAWGNGYVFVAEVRQSRP